MTVYALRGRGLLQTPRTDGVWTARLTDAGRFYLEHGYHPDRPSGEADRAVGKRASPNSGPATAAAELQVTVDELLASLRAGNGKVRIADPNPQMRAGWRRAIDATKRQRRIPDGQRLVHHGRDNGDLVVRLVEAPPPKASRAIPLPRIDVPADLVEPHPAIATIISRPETLNVSEHSRPRALLMLQALCAEGERCGYRVEIGDESATLRVHVGEDSYGLVMGEEWDSVEQLPHDLAGAKAYGWQRIQPQQVSVPSGRLTLRFTDQDGRRARWADRSRWSLEDKLGEVLAEIDTRATAAKQQRVDAAQAASQRQIRWEAAMATARQRFLDDHRRKALLSQVDAWTQAQAICAYSDELEKLAAAEPDAERAADMLAWASWAADQASTVDPLSSRPGVPADPDPRPEDLRPYLGTWSPYGPDTRY